METGEIQHLNNTDFFFLCVCVCVDTVADIRGLMVKNVTGLVGRQSISIILKTNGNSLVHKST